MSALKKVMGDDFAGRFGAWWNGRDYVPPMAEEAAVEAPAKPVEKTPPAPAAVPAPAPEAVDEALFDAPAKPAADMPAAMDPRFTTSGSTARLRALETIWGDGRFAPGSRTLDQKLLDAAGGCDQSGEIGFIGVDGAILRACALRSERQAKVVEWRAACVDRLRELAPTASVVAAEIDRPRGFEDGQLAALVSIEAFAYADHKAGLVGRAHRSLNGAGKWAFLDTTRTTKKTPAEAFASAWAEPQIATADELEELLTLAGFKSVKRENVTPLVLAAAKEGYARLSQALESAASGGLTGREGALYLQELAWEAQSWRARCRALEGGALSIDVWTVSKEADPLGAAPPLDLTAAITDAIDAKPLKPASDEELFS